MMKLVADLLDKQLVDRDGHPCGKVDGIVLTVGHGPPRVSAIEVGCVTLADRLGRRAGRGMRRLVSRLGDRIAGRYRIPWRRIRDVGPDVHVDLSAERADLLRAERWLRDRIVRRIPGA
jgi:sporulation protein YlmC with PRC-barrel domain